MPKLPHTSGAEAVRHPLVAKIVKAYEEYLNPIAGDSKFDRVK